MIFFVNRFIVIDAIIKKYLYFMIEEKKIKIITLKLYIKIQEKTDYNQKLLYLL